MLLGYCVASSGILLAVRPTKNVQCIALWFRVWLWYAAGCLSAVSSLAASSSRVVHNGITNLVLLPAIRCRNCSHTLARHVLRLVVRVLLSAGMLPLAAARRGIVRCTRVLKAVAHCATYFKQLLQLITRQQADT